MTSSLAAPCSPACSQHQQRPGPQAAPLAACQLPSTATMRCPPWQALRPVAAITARQRLPQPQAHLSSLLPLPVPHRPTSCAGCSTGAHPGPAAQHTASGSASRQPSCPHAATSPSARRRRRKENCRTTSAHCPSGQHEHQHQHQHQRSSPQATSAAVCQQRSAALSLCCQRLRCCQWQVRLLQVTAARQRLWSPRKLV